MNPFRFLHDIGELIDVRENERRRKLKPWQRWLEDAPDVVIIAIAMIAGIGVTLGPWLIGMFCIFKWVSK